MAITCVENNSFTPKQKAIVKRMRHYCGNMKRSTLDNKLAMLQHELKVLNTTLRDKVRKATRSRINKIFSTDQRNIYREWRSSNIEVKHIPKENEIHSFWSGIWGKKSEINVDSEWHNNLRMEYCKNVSSKTYSITPETIDIVLGKTPNNRAPGTDHIVGYWLKRCSSLHEELRQQMILLMEGQEIMPPWLATCRTILIPKNSATHMPNNYRPIACQNSMYKLYTGILNLFLDDHCISNNIIYDEQAGGRKGAWGCADQLLISCS